MPLGGMATMGAIGIGSKLIGGLFGSSASKQYQKSLQQAQNYLQGQETQGLQNYSPYLNAGSGATATLSSLLGVPGQGLLQNWMGQFSAPTAAEAASTPGYQFQLQQGENAIQNSAAAKGSLLTGRTLADLNNYAQGAASTNYQNTFNNALTQYQSAYNTFLNNQNNQYSRLMGLSGEGLQATQGAGNFMQGMGGDIASLMGQQGAAKAGGTMALGQGISGALNDLGQSFTLSQLMGGGGGSDGATSVSPFSTNSFSSLLNASNNPTSGVTLPFPGMAPGVIPGGTEQLNLGMLG